MKKILKIALVFGSVMLLTSVVQAFDIAGGDPAKGKDSYGECRKCHDGGKAKNLSPSHKTKKQWTRYFDKEQKKLKRKHDDWDSFNYSIDFLEDVHRYVVDHALDSDKPQTCD